MLACLSQGAGSGLGFEAARCLAAVGGRVTVAARSQAAAEDAVKRMRAALGNAGATADLSPLALDLSSLASVEAGAKAFLAATPSLDVLINNAGVMAAPLTTTPDGLETQVRRLCVLPLNSRQRWYRLDPNLGFVAR